MITGTGRGIGASLARVCRNQGWEVIACQRTLNNDESDKKVSCDSSYHPIELDVSNEHSVQIAFEKIQREFSHVDVLVNNAGVFPEPTDAPFESLKSSWFQETMNVNLLGTFMVTRACLPLLRKSRNPRIVNISSGAACITHREGRRYCYGASKAALNHLTRGLANELKDQQVTVVALSPGWVRTEMGGENADLDVTEVTREMELTISKLAQDQTGQFLDRFGKTGTYSW